MAARAVRIFPQLCCLNVVRTWAALRVMTEDGFPIYDQSASCPGAFIATCFVSAQLASVATTASAMIGRTTSLRTLLIVISPLVHNEAALFISSHFAA